MQPEIDLQPVTGVATGELAPLVPQLSPLSPSPVAVSDCDDWCEAAISNHSQFHRTYCDNAQCSGCASCTCDEWCIEEEKNFPGWGARGGCDNTDCKGCGMCFEDAASAEADSGADGPGASAQQPAAWQAPSSPPHMPTEQTEETRECFAWCEASAAREKAWQNHPEMEGDCYEWCKEQHKDDYKHVTGWKPDYKNDSAPVSSIGGGETGARLNVTHNGNATTSSQDDESNGEHSVIMSCIVSDEPTDAQMEKMKEVIAADANVDPSAVTLSWHDTMDDVEIGRASCRDRV